MMEPKQTIKRRDFIKKAGLGSMALAAYPMLSHLQAEPAQATGQINFHFACLNTGGVIDGIYHTLLMAGDGKFNSSGVVGNGTFQHTNTDPELPAPKPIVGEGTWKAKSLKDWDLLGTFGVGIAGVLTLEIVLVSTTGQKIPAELEVTCNIPPAGLFTGNPEGYVLTIPDGLTFVPQGVGITWFTSPVEQKG